MAEARRRRSDDGDGMTAGRFARLTVKAAFWTFVGAASLAVLALVALLGWLSVAERLAERRRRRAHAVTGAGTRQRAGRPTATYPRA